MPPIPITIITGFLGSGKTTLILHLIPQLPKSYKLALLKNEFGDLAIDSQLASSSAISGVQELLNGCICCNLVGQLGDALDTLRTDVEPDRIIIETSGSAFPATLAMEVNRLGRETGHYALDGVVVVIDVENWQGYEDTSYTAKLQAKYTDLIVFNKWELVSERRYEDCLDRVGDLELQVANLKSDKGRVDEAVLLGLDSAMARNMDLEHVLDPTDGHHHEHSLDHQNEVEVLSVSLASGRGMDQGVDREALATFLFSAPKDEIYRIKAIVASSLPPASSDGSRVDAAESPTGTVSRYILNWAFGRWTFTPVKSSQVTANVPPPPTKENRTSVVLQMTIISARHEAEKWKKRLIADQLLKLENSDETGDLRIERLS
ncbi:hypothetical protein MMC13_000493 [Lambiella insularis]|nr:hypothetical protein [Lambiella insularis]